MSKAATKPQTSHGSRPRCDESSTRASSSDPRPAQVHELKLQTQKLRQQARLLRTQLKRTEDRINSQTNAINKTFESSGEKPQSSSSIHAFTIPNIKRNIEGAQHTLDHLKEQIELAENDDRTSAVEELEEELKVTYCEYQRLAKALQDKKAEANHFDKQLSEAEYRASNQHINELKAAIKNTRTQNASLRDKANAYQVKIEKMKIEQLIAQHYNNKVPTKKTLDDLEVERAEQNKRMNELCDELNEEAEEHDKNVAELQDIIEEMKLKISNRLTGEEQTQSEQHDTSDTQKNDSQNDTTKNQSENDHHEEEEK